MVKFKLKVESVSIDTAINKDNEKFNRLYVNFSKIGDRMYRVGEFLSFAECQILRNQYPDIDLDTIQEADISKVIKQVELVSEENRFGLRQFLNVHFNVGYIKKINLENDDYFLILTSYKETATVQATVTTKK